MNINEVKAKAFDAIVSAYYGDKLNKTYVEALISIVTQLSMEPIKEEPVVVKPLTVEVVNDTTEVVEEKKPEPKKATKKATGRKSTVDKGKIKACFEGGWSIAKIADEMGLDKSTITYHLKNMGLK